jgi:hypothetical protein
LKNVNFGAKGSLEPVDTTYVPAKLSKTLRLGMTKIIELPIDLGAHGYVRFVRKITEGHLAATFLAQVNYQGELRRAYIKMYDHTAQPKAVFNEVLGYLYAQAMGIPSPSVFFVDVPPLDVVACGLPASHTPVRAVATLEAHDPNVATDGAAKTLFNAGSIDLTYIRQRLLASPSGRALVAFDEVTGNDDRNIGNIVFSWKQGVVAIDHGCILGGPLWTSQSLNSTHNFENKAFTIINEKPIGNSDKSALQAAAQVMLETYYEAMPALQSAMGYPTDIDTSTAFDFVWWKANGLTSRMAHMLQKVM